MDPLTSAAVPVPRRRVSIKVKLAALIAAVSMLVLMLGIGLMSLLQYRDSVEATEARLRNLIEVTAAAAGAPLAFDDAPGAKDVLEPLRRLPELAAARLSTPGGKVLAQIEVLPGALAAFDLPQPARDFRLSGAGALGVQVDTLRLLDRGAALTRVMMPVTLNGDVLGRASVVVDRKALEALRDRLLIGGGVLAAVLGAAVVLLSLVVQRLVSAPVIALTEVMREVSESGNYERKVARRSNDELGDLALGLNSMLEQIRERDARLAGYNEALENTVRTRTAELAATVEELRSAKDRAEAASRAKSQFLANMSHEIRTPMNGVLGTADLMAFTQLNERQSQLLGIMQRSGQSLLALLNDILDFSKIEAGKLELEQVRFDLRELIHEVAELFATSALQKGVSLDLRYPPELPATLNTDPSRLRQVLVNLVGNALKFTETGSVSIQAIPVHEAGGRLRVRFSVTDTGVGIAEEALNRIFEEFAQADDSMSRRFGGTGLGLTISRRLVAMMGGRIEVDSRPGRGSTFWFSLEADEAPVSAATAGVGSPLDDPDVARRLADLSVVCCIREPQLREFVQSHLAAWRINAQSFASASAAFESLQREPADGRERCVLLLADDPEPFAQIEPALAALASARAKVAGLILLSASDLPAPYQADSRLRHLALPLRVSALLNRLIEFGHEGTPPPVKLRSGQGRQPLRFDASVLVAEDHPVNQLVTRGQLEMLGCRVVMAENGVKAVDAAEREAFDLILMDCQMPEMDGFTATARIRERERDGAARRVPIVALTAHALKGDREACLAAGMDDYLMKPFKSEELQALLARWLSPELPESPAPDPTLDEEDAMPSDSTVSPAREDAFDPAALQALKDADPTGIADLLDEIAGIYVDDAHQRIAAIVSAAQAGDAPAVHRNSHPLASASGSLGLLRMQSLCREIDAEARTGGVQAALRHQAELQQAFEAAREWLVSQRKAFRAEQSAV